jgi:hypothetical protein
MSRPLTTKQKRFLENHVIKGMSIAESVRRAGYNVTSGRSEDYGSLGCRMLKTDRVRNYFEKLKAKEFSKMALSVEEKRAFLARAVRCDVSSPDADLIQEVSETSGEHGVSRRVKVVDRLRALELDSKIAGDFYSDREPQANNPFLFIVSFGKSANNNPDSLPDKPVIDAEIIPS